MSPLWLLLFAGLVALVVYVYKRQYQRRGANEPPLVAGIPFLGVALSYGKNPLSFIAECKKKFGDIFTLYVAGKRMHIVCDVLVFPPVFKNSQWKFDPFARRVALQVFDISKDTFDRVDKVFHQQYIGFLSGKGLVPLTLSVQDKLYKHLVKAKGKKSWTEAQLNDFSKQIIFFSSGDSLFGKDFSNPTAMEEFQTFDKSFTKFLAGLPYFMYKDSVKARSLLQKRVGLTYDEPSMWIQERFRVMQESGVKQDQMEALQNSILWGAQANTVPASFWIIAHLLTDKEAREAINEEIEAVMADAERDGERVIFTPEKLAQMVKLDSAISEALRLHSAPLMVREIMDDSEITLSNGDTYSLRTGDTVMLNVYMLHCDDGVFPNAKQYKWDRFLGDNVKFYKNGKELKTPTLPFGGGISLCPGRHFARNEMKIFVAFALYYFDMELLGKMPDHDETRAGLGIMPPVRDVAFRYKLKDSRL